MNRFDNDIRLLFEQARDEVRQMGHQSVEPEHVLLALLSAQTPVRGPLQEVAVHLDALRAEVGQGRHPPRLPGMQEVPPLSPAVRRLTERAAQLAKQQDAYAAGAIHLLLALLENAQVQTLLHAANLDARELAAIAQAGVQTALPGVAPPRPALNIGGPGKPLAQLLSETSNHDGVPPDDLTRESLLLLALADGHAGVLAQLEGLLLRWLGTPTLNDMEKRELLHALIQWGSRPR